YWFGWGVFAVALVIFFYITAKLIPESAPEGRPLPPMATAANQRADAAGMVLALAALLALPALSALLRSVRPAAPIVDALGADPPPAWAPAPVDIPSSWQPRFNGADQQRRLAFANSNGAAVEVYTVVYRNQRQGAELIGSGSTVIGSTLRPRAAQLVQMAAGRFRGNEGAGRAAPYREYILLWRFQIARGRGVLPLAAAPWDGGSARE